MKTTMLFSAAAASFLFACIGNLKGQAYFNGNVSETGTRANLKNAKIMVINGADTAFFPVKADGSYNIVTKEGKNKLFAVADGYVTELNSINAAKGSVNKVDISLVKRSTVNTDPGKRHKYESMAPATYSAPAYSPPAGGSGRTETWMPPTFGMERKSIGTTKYLPKTTPGGMIAAPGAAGRLTAGSVLDFGKWTDWNNLIVGDFEAHRKQWRIVTSNRYVVQVANDAGNPVIDADVVLKINGKTAWQARTDNTGKAELWENPFAAETGVNAESRRVSADVTAYGAIQTIKKLIPFAKGINFITANGPCSVSDQLDIAFVVDATGSMGDEINYLKKDLDTLIKSISYRNRDINLRMASVFYRDQGDEYVVRQSPFSSNTTITDNFILDQKANGGGDYPEAVDLALKEAVNNLAWSSSARARIIFLLLDAPPHVSATNIDTLHRYIQLAAAKGIRVVPVACSGTDKSTEMRMRSMALLTNGKYLFLTNHSGIGSAHIEPSLETYAVRSLLEEMLLVSSEFSMVPDCDKYIDPQQIVYTDSLRKTENPSTDKSLVLSASDSARLRDSAIIREKGLVGALTWIKFWPNPTEGLLNVKIETDIKEIYVADISGKLMERVQCNKGDLLKLDLSRYTSGIYYIKYPTAAGWMAERIVLRR